MAAVDFTPGAAEPYGKTSLAVLEEFFTTDLNMDMAWALERLPRYQARELLERLQYGFKTWLRRERANAKQSASTTPFAARFQPIFSNDSNLRDNAGKLEQWLKCALLYLPGEILYPDPIGSVDDMEYVSIALESGDGKLVDRIIGNLATGVKRLLPLKPLIDAGIVSLLPWPTISQVFDDRGRAWAFRQMLSETDRSQWHRIAEPAPYSGSIDELLELDAFLDRFTTYDEDTNEPLDIDLESIVCAEWWWIGSRLGYASLAADTPARRLMTADLGDARQAALLDRRIARLFSEFSVPGPSSAATEEVVRLRLNEEAFSEFRMAFEHILRQVAEADPADDTIFSDEFSRHASATLYDRRSAVIRSRRRSDVLQGILTSAGLAGAAIVESSITHQFPIGSSLAATAATVGWLIPAIRTRAAESASRMLLTKFYGYLIPEVSPV